MRGILRKCTVCGRYTLRQDRCPYCGGALRTPHPPKFSPEDRYGKYRRMLKKLVWEEQLKATQASSSSPSSS